MKYFSFGQQKILFVLALFILIVIYFQFYYRPFRSPLEENFKEVVVEVIGEVRNPGIQIFHHSPTLKESIEKAGGLKDIAFFDRDSSLEALETGTLLSIVKESQKISPSPSLIKRGEEGLLKEKLEGINQNVIKIKIGRMEARKLLVFSIPLDLSRVSLEDLCLVPGIGESLAHEMISYRERRRGFRSVEELKNVKGIGENKWVDIKKFFIVK